MKEFAESDRSSLIPHFSALRRVPTRYQQILPLPIMKRYQCLVVGSAPGVLTVAITDQHKTAMLQTLQQFTGHAIFPVLIDPGRMRLILQRMERCDQYKSGFSSLAGRGPWNAHAYRRTLLHLQLASIVRFSSSDTAPGLKPCGFCPPGFS